MQPTVGTLIGKERDPILEAGCLGLVGGPKGRSWRPSAGLLLELLGCAGCRKVSSQWLQCLSTLAAIAVGRGVFRSAAFTSQVHRISPALLLNLGCEESICGCQEGDRMSDAG